MDLIELVLTVCAVASPATCEEAHLQFAWNGSLTQCAMAAPPYIAQWIGDHPKWNAVRWRCEYPHTKEKADARGPARAT
jgi:hypothetical protein